jgi:hypothetical protein
MSLLPDKLKLEAWRGATFRITMTLYQEDEDGPVRDLTDYEATLEVRAEKGDSTVLLTLSTDNGGIIIDEEEGEITLVSDVAEIEEQEWTQGIYDLTITAPGGDTEAILYGAFVIRGVD